MSNALIVELERLRMRLATILSAKGKTVTDEAKLQTLIPLVNSIGVNDEFKKLCEGSNFEIDDVEGNILNFTNWLGNKALITKLKSESITRLVASSLSGASSLTELYIPNCVAVETSALYGLSSLTDITIGNISEMGREFLTGAAALTSIKLGTLAAGNECFMRNCTNLQKFEVGSFTTFTFDRYTSQDNAAFVNDKALVLVDMGYTPAFTGSSDSPTAFSSCTNFKAFVMRKKDTVATLSSNKPFTWLNNNLAGLWHFYVPYSLVDTYKAASNWSTYASYFTSIQENLVDLLSYGMDITEYYEIVDEKPENDIDATIVYLIETDEPGTYEQWFYGSGSWEQLADITLEEAVS